MHEGSVSLHVDLRGIGRKKETHSLWADAAVMGLLSAGLTEENTAMQAIGYKETAAALRGEYDLGEAKARIKQASRRYAKRQLSWLRRDPGLHWILWQKKPDLEKAASVSTQILENSGIL